jgi:hypothetical protein
MERRSINLILVSIILLALPCYCVGGVALYYAPPGNNPTPVPTVTPTALPSVEPTTGTPESTATLKPTPTHQHAGAHVDRDGDADAHAHRHADTDHHTDADHHADGDLHAHTDAHTHRHTNRDGDKAAAHQYTDRNGDRIDANRNQASAHGHVDTDSYGAYRNAVAADPITVRSGASCESHLPIEAVFRNNRYHEPRRPRA